MDTGQPGPGGQTAELTTREEEPWRPLLAEAARKLAPEAAVLWDRVLDMMPADHPERPRVHSHRGRAAWACGDHHAAMVHARLALATTDDPDIVTRANAIITLATMALQGAGVTPEALDLDSLLSEHTAGAATRTQDLSLAVALADQALTELLGGHTRQGTRTAAAVLRLVGPDDDNSRAVIPARMALALSAVYDGRVSDARAIADQFMSRVDDSESMWVVAYAPWAVDGMVWTAAGEHQKAIETFTTGRTRARAAGLPVIESLIDPVEALTHLMSGDWNAADAVADAHIAARDDGRPLMYHPWLHATKAIVAARRDDPTSARTLLEAVSDQTPSFHGGGHLIGWAQANLARTEGRHDEAREIMRAIEGAVSASGSQVGWVPIALDLIHQEFEEGATARARCRAIISRLAPGHGASPVVEAMWHGAHSFAAGDLGGISDAATVLGRSFPFEAARFYVGGMVVAHWQGRNSSAVGMARRAHLAFGRLGAVVEQRRLLEVLAERDLDLPDLGQDPVGLDSLTEEEARVAALVCEGHSTAEVAAAVGVVVPKARALLQEVYRKTGVNDRVRLAALVAASAPS